MKPATRLFYEKVNGLINNDVQRAVIVLSKITLFIVAGYMAMYAILLPYLSAWDYTQDKNVFLDILRTAGLGTGAVSAVALAYLIRRLLSKTAKDGGFGNMKADTTKRIRILSLAFMICAIVGALSLLLPVINRNIDENAFVIIVVFVCCIILRAITIFILCRQLSAAPQNGLPHCLPVMLMILFNVFVALLLFSQFIMRVFFLMPFGNIIVILLFVFEMVQLLKYYKILSEEHKSCGEEPDTPENKKPDK